MKALAPALLLLLASCGAPGATTSVRVAAGQEAHVTFRGEDYGVTITNEGPADIDVLWPTRMLDITLPAGADSYQTLPREGLIRITARGDAGASVKLDAPRADSVRSEVVARAP